MAALAEKVREKVRRRVVSDDVVAKPRLSAETLARMRAADVPRFKADPERLFVRK